MRVIIAGSRSISDLKIVEQAVLDSGLLDLITEVVSGRCCGIDQLGEKFAHKHRIRVKLFPAQWKKYGKAAGPIRNEEMANYADVLIAIWDGKSSGTNNMINVMKAMGKQVFVKVINKE